MGGRVGHGAGGNLAGSGGDAVNDQRSCLTCHNCIVVGKAEKYKAVLVQCRPGYWPKRSMTNLILHPMKLFAHDCDDYQAAEAERAEVNR